MNCYGVTLHFLMLNNYFLILKIEFIRGQKSMLYKYSLLF